MSPPQAAMVPKDELAMGARMHSQVRPSVIIPLVLATCPMQKSSFMEAPFHISSLKMIPSMSHLIHNPNFFEAS